MRVYLPRPLSAVVRRSRRPGAFLTALCLAVLLSGCGGGEAPSESAGAAPAADPAAAAQAPQAVATIDGASAAARGELALREQRAFLPAGDNAFELFLAAVEANPGDERSRLALQDLVPYAVLHIEQRLAAEDAEDAARVIAQLARAAGEAPALPRLQAGLESLQTRLASARAAADARAAAPAPVAVAAPVELPASAVPPPPPVQAPAPPTAPPPEPIPARTAPSPVAEAPAPIRAPAAPRVPEVVFRPALRYPPMAERRRIEGFVEMEFTIGADGSVSQVEVLRSEPEGMFDREALAAMERWRFAPPDAPMRARRTLEFKLAR